MWLRGRAIRFYVHPLQMPIELSKYKTSATTLLLRHSDTYQMTPMFMQSRCLQLLQIPLNDRKF